MGKGRRYEKEPKLNMKKVFAVIIAVVVLVMFIFIIQGILQKGQDSGKITSESYFAMFKDNKWGVINSKGEVVIDPSYAEIIVIPDNNKDVFLCTYDVNYETGEFKTKAINSKNEEILKGYEQLEAVTNSDENNNLWYETNVIRVKKNGKYGLIDLDGKEILSAEYDQINALKGIKNSLLTLKDGKYGIVNDEGKILVQNKYAEITTLEEDDKSGFIVKNDEGKYGILSYSENQILDTKYDGIYKVYGNDMYVVKEADKQKLVGKDGNVILENGYNEIKAILKNKDNGIIIVKDGKYGVIKTNGETVIEAQYDDLKEAKEGILIAKKDNKYGVIDLTNAVKVEFKYANITYNENADMYILEDENATANILNSNFETKLTGILNELNEEKGYIKLRVGEEYKYYNFKFEQKRSSEVLTANTLYLSKKDGKYGYVDKSENVVIDYIYDDAQEQNSYGFAAVKKDGKWGCIDSNGKTVIEPTYNLDNNLVIDFIGKWYLGQDMNLNYYKQ